LRAHKFFSSARLSKFGQGLRSVHRPYVGLSKPTLDAFCDGHTYNGKWSMICKSCGWNTTHTSGYHDKWVADPKSFSLPATHIFWSKTGKTPPEGANVGSVIPITATTATAASVTSSSSLSSRVGPLIAQYKTNTKDGQFVSFLADFERVLN